MIVTEVALELCQLRVTLCPVSIEVGVAARVTVGLGGGGGGVLVPAQPLKHANTVDASPKPRQREGKLILNQYSSNFHVARQFQMPAAGTTLALI